MDPRRHLVVFLLSLTLVGMELIWTRLFSAEFFYAFAFLTLSLAIMGLGLGALALRMLPAFNRERSLGLFLCLTGLATLAGPLLVFCIGLKFSELFLSWSMLARFVVAIGLLGAAFFFGGVCLALLLRRNHADLARLYMADLVGAGAGVLAAVVLMNVVGTPSATFLCPLPVLIAALLACRSWSRVAPVVLIAGMIVLSVQAGPVARTGAARTRAGDLQALGRRGEDQGLWVR